MSSVADKPPFLQAYPTARIPLLLICLTLLTLSTLSLAQTAAPAVSAETNAIQNVEPSVAIAANSSTQTQSVSSLSSEQSNAIRQDLARIITSEDYASAQEITTWQAIEKPDNDNVDMGWLETLLEAMFGSSDGAQSTIALFSLLLKALVIGALIAFIVWVLRRAGYLAGWAERISKHTGRRSTTIKQANYQQQGWEQLPAHEQIPTRVKQYLADGEIIQAASILYRGSLRWLVVSEQLSIAAANTEQQCLAQIQQLAPFKNSKPHVFIRRIISLWIQIAYDEQQRAQNSIQLSEQLYDYAHNWLLQLPASNGSASATTSTSTKAADNLGAG